MPTAQELKGISSLFVQDKVKVFMEAIVNAAVKAAAEGKTEMSMLVAEHFTSSSVRDALDKALEEEFQGCTVTVSMHQDLVVKIKWA